jgi:hypothetical protein
VSPENNKVPGGSFSPAAKLTWSQYQEIALFFRDFLADKPLIKWSIIAAGVGGLLDTLHVGWLALRFIFRF